VSGPFAAASVRTEYNGGGGGACAGGRHFDDRHRTCVDTHSGVVHHCAAAASKNQHLSVSRGEARVNELCFLPVCAAHCLSPISTN